MSDPVDGVHALVVDELEPDEEDHRGQDRVGHVGQGAVRNSSTTTTMSAGVSWANWLRPPAPSTISVLVGLPLTTKVPDESRGEVARAQADQVEFSSKLSPYSWRRPATCRALGQDDHEHREHDGQQGAMAERRLDWPAVRSGSPPGTGPRMVTPRAADRSVARDDRAHDGDERAGILVDPPRPTMMASTVIDTASVGRLAPSGIARSALANFSRVCRSPR